MRRGKKRGAPSSEGSGSRKSGGDASGDRKKRGDGSAGLARGEGGSEQKKEVIVLQEAVKLSDARQQSSLRDVKKVRWALKTDSLGIVQMSFDDFKTVLRRRRRLFKRVMSLHINGIPVTQLNHGPKETYHIVEITLDGRVIFQLLFRQSDGYLIAFRLVKNEQNPLAWEGWFHFSDPDIKLPVFFDEQRSVEWECGYLTADKVSIWKQTMHSLVTCVLDYKPENCTKKSFGGYETWMVLFGECQRSGVFVDFVERHHDSEQPTPVGWEREDLLHSWGNFCSPVLHIHLALLMRDYGERGWKEELAKAELKLTQAVSAVTEKGYNLIKRCIVYRSRPDGIVTEKINGELSMPRLLGTEVDHLLHLINCDSKLCAHRDCCILCGNSQLWLFGD